LDLLGEQMQASCPILGLRAMLRGAQSDEYTADSQAMRHVTYGFPITVSTPHRYDNKAAEIEISVCNPKEVQQNIPPSLGLMLPQEKTYNVASMVSAQRGWGRAPSLPVWSTSGPTSPGLIRPSTWSNSRTRCR
jgi:hypothetical protein